MQVTVNDLELSYGDHHAIRTLDLTIPDGKSVVLLGESGCGKTSTMRCIAGLESPNGGSIRIGNDAVFDSHKNIVLPPYRRNVGMVFQSYAVWPHRTVRENVEFPLKMQQMSPSRRKQRAMEVLELVGLAHLSERGASALSGGQMQRVALARSMAMGPSVMLLDEPLSNLDARLRDELRVELRRIQIDQGLTSLYVTHDQQEALSLADEVAIMQQGKITQIGSPEQVYTAPVSASIAAFLGISNIFAVGPRSERGSVDVLDHDITLRSAQSLPRGMASACIRPEDIRLSRESTAHSAPGADVNRFACTVDVAVYQGASIRTKLTTDSGLHLEATSAPFSDGGIHPGDRLFAEITANDVRLLPDESPVLAEVAA